MSTDTDKTTTINFQVDIPEDLERQVISKTNDVARKPILDNMVEKTLRHIQTFMSDKDHIEQIHADIEPSIKGIDYEDNVSVRWFIVDDDSSGDDKPTTPYPPLQPTYEDIDGRVRFNSNKIVDYLLEAGPFDMNDLAKIDFSNEDREQFAMLIGYSLNGMYDLSYVSDELLARVESSTLQEVDNESTDNECNSNILSDAIDEDLTKRYYKSMFDLNSRLEDHDYMWPSIVSDPATTDTNRDSIDLTEVGATRMNYILQVTNGFRLTDEPTILDNVINQFIFGDMRKGCSPRWLKTSVAMPASPPRSVRGSDKQ